MSKILTWVLKLIPEQYRIGVAIKKVSYMVGKLAVSFLAYGKVKMIVGDNLTPDQIMQIQTATAALTGAALEGLHDWARVKWPNVALL